MQALLQSSAGSQSPPHTHCLKHLITITFEEDLQESASHHSPLLLQLYDLRGIDIYVSLLSLSHAFKHTLLSLSQALPLSQLEISLPQVLVQIKGTISLAGFTRLLRQHTYNSVAAYSTLCNPFPSWPLSTIQPDLIFRSRTRMHTNRNHTPG